MSLSSSDDNSLAAKWSEAIAEDGFTMVPNSLLKHYGQLGLTPSEFLILVNIESYRWEADNFPFPSVETLAKRVDMKTRTVTRIITRLHKDKRLIIRRPRRNTSNEYSFYPIIYKLTQLVRQEQQVNVHRNHELSGTEDTSGLSDLTILSPKEDPLNNINNEHFTNVANSFYEGQQ